ncbi:acyl-CoA dehydrogenase [Thermomonospora cellulosilytica]|uniref:Alkylation response protein AidB-like acyl-CoA dehydrogenase n=1 Tax=Thermomonospora cellulosilytica TaxID=1411118 RepID=A0A7W3RAI3_9ACTN|nr:acyl-CoA dehydrogenase [Thermomonospora cellulosilytica]MBA9005340.1 alkylation response protein AidB-like acyl-CoA dehydrogenase [Thermomonospora cellulosilytica]
MGIAVSAEHRELADTVRSLLTSHKAREAGRALLESDRETPPGFWNAFAELGLLGVHLPEEFGGGGFGLPELVVVAEELGRSVAPGPMLPTVMASAVIAARGGDGLRARLLPRLAAGTAVGALGLSPGNAELEFNGDDTGGGTLTGRSGAVLGGALAGHVVLAVGDDLVVVPADADGVTAEVPTPVDWSRRPARFRFDGVRIGPDEVLTGARRHAEAVARVLVAAEATGGALECVDAATAYAKVRRQFGRTIGTFQAVKHHLANMLVAAETATAAVWDAARAADGAQEEFELAAAVAAAVAVPAFVDNAGLNIQVHGGIGFTWEHDAHLLLRRAVTLNAIVSPDAAAADVTRLGAAGVARTATLDLPPEAEEARAGIRALARELAALPADEQRRRLADSGHLQPHWPRPWGIDASPGLQVVIEQEFRAAGVTVPNLGITGWVILTLIQHGTEDQVARWVRPALYGEHVWCQLFSEPEAGSDAAAVRTRGERVEGGWRVNGQKVWTSGAHEARYGLATVRTDPSAGKHAGITMMVVDMGAPGVQVRPLRQITGGSDFNEVFFTDVFVPDADVVGEPGQGWTVARATLGNERVSLGGGLGGTELSRLFQLYAQYGDRVPAAEVRVGRHAARDMALRTLNLRRAVRAVQGGDPGPEGNVTKLALAEHGQRTAALLAEFAGEETAFAEGFGGIAATSLLGVRALTIAGGTSEISRNQIAERILGLPRDPLVR